jgi:DNA-binding helix-hairpin-helix protein with protein kinase domain
LESHEISDAKIEKIGPAKKKSLLAGGIETAYDVLSVDITSVPGIGPKLQMRLVSWASAVEQTAALMSTIRCSTARDACG